MAGSKWYVKGKSFGNCNCDYGCPCQFNALPTNGDCQAAECFVIEEGRFDNVKLDGVPAVGLYKWPGPVHEGNGTMQIVIDESASAEQRAAIEKIMTGQDTKEMGTMWWVYSAMCPNKLPTLYRAIEFDVDVDGRRGRFKVPGVVETHGEPIRNPVTGNEHRVRIDLPNGFEYRVAEIGSGTTKATGDIKLDHAKSYGQFARMHINQDGVVN